MTMSERSPPPDFEQMELLPSMSFAEDSPARTSASLAPEQDWPEPEVDCGPRSPVWLASFDRDTSSWRTCQHSVEGGLELFSETWPRSGTMRSGTAYRLPPLVPLTYGTESGSLRIPTPTKTDATMTGENFRTCTYENPNRGVSLANYTVMYPTPTTNDRPNEGSVRLLRQRVLDGTMAEQEAEQILGKSPFEAQGKVPKMWPTPTVDGNYNRKGVSAKSGNGLETEVRLWPTPTSTDGKGSVSLERERAREGASSRGVRLPEQLALTEDREVGGRLNPDWVEWLMGFPIGHTVLLPSEMPLSQKSRTSSRKKSTTTKPSVA